MRYKVQNELYHFCLHLASKSKQTVNRSSRIGSTGVRWIFCTNTSSIQLPSKIFKKNSDVLFTLKAFNGRVVLEWLSDEMATFCLDDNCTVVDIRSPHIAAALNLFSICLLKP